MTDEKDIAALKIGDVVKGSVTVRGNHLTEEQGMVLASPLLKNWQAAQGGRLSTDMDFDASDAFAAKPQGEYSVTRTLTVRAKA